MEKKLSIVHVIDILNAGGAERVLITLANLQHKFGHRVKVITTVKQGELLPQLSPSIEYTNLHRQWKWNPFTMYRLTKALKGFDVIHVHSSHNLRYVFLSTRIFFQNKKIFYQEHFGNIIHQQLSTLQMGMYKRVFFIAVSNAMAQWAVNKLKLYPQQVFHLPNIVVKENIAVKEEKKSDEINFIVIANFLPNKNLEFIINLFSCIKKNLAKSSLTIIGKAADKDYYKKILQLIQQQQLQQHITILQNCNEVQPLLNHFHIGMHSSFSESGPLVLIEYLAQNIPFVTFNTGEVTFQIRESLPEFILNDFDINSWMARIQSLLSKDKQYWQQTLPQVFDKFFSAEKYYQKSIAIYRQSIQLA